MLLSSNASAGLNLSRREPLNKITNRRIEVLDGPLAGFSLAASLDSC
jgi:hypothetical protein